METNAETEPNKSRNKTSLVAVERERERKYQIKVLLKGSEVVITQCADR